MKTFKYAFVRSVPIMAGYIVLGLGFGVLLQSKGYDAPEGVDQSRYFFWVSLLDQFYWVVGCVAGALLGSVLPFDTTGIDFSMTALFLVVMTEQWKASRDHTPALVGLGVSLVCLLIFGSSNFLIPSMLGITAALTLLRKVTEKKEADHAV